MQRNNSYGMRHLKNYCFIILTFFIYIGSQAQSTSDSLTTESYVMDHAQLLNPVEMDSLKLLLQDYRNNASLTFVFITESNFNPDSVTSILNSIRSHYPAKKSVFILFDKSNSKAYSAVSPDLNEVLTEKFCAQVTRQIIEASFKQHQYYEGLKGALLAYSGTLQGNYKLKPNLNPEYSPKAFVIPVAISVAFVLAAILASAYSERKVRRLMHEFDIPDFNARIILGIERPVNPENGGWEAFKGGGEAGQW